MAYDEDDELQRLARLRAPGITEAIDSTQLPDEAAIASRFATPAVGGAAPAAAPVEARKPLTAAPKANAPAAVDEVPTYQAPRDDGSVAAARESDALERLMASVQHAGRALNAGLTRTPMQPTDRPEMGAEAAAQAKLMGGAQADYGRRLGGYNAQTQRLSATRPARAPAEKPVDPVAQERERVKLDTDKERLKQLQAPKPTKALKPKDNSKALEADALIRIPGYEASTDVRVKPEIAQKLRDGVAQQRSIESTVGKIQELYKRYGNTPLPGPEKSRMEGLVTDLQLALKGESQFGLGVLTGPDLALLEKVTGNPTRADASVVDFFSDGENTAAKLDNVLGQSSARMRNKLEQSGYRPAAKTPGATSESGKVLVKRNGQLGYVSKPLPTDEVQ